MSVAGNRVVGGSEVMGQYIRLEDSINVVLTKSHSLATALLYAEVKRSVH